MEEIIAFIAISAFILWMKGTEVLSGNEAEHLWLPQVVLGLGMEMKSGTCTRT